MYDTDRPSRRRFLQQTGLGLLALSAAPWRRAFADAMPQNAMPQNAITPQAALDRLMAGNARYASNHFDIKDFSGRARRARESAISDRVDPERAPIRGSRRN